MAAFEVISSAKNTLNGEDLQSNIVFYTDNQYRLLDDVRELNFLIGWRDFIEEENLCSIENLCKCYSSVKVRDISTTAQKIFTPANLVITVSNDSRILAGNKLNNTLEYIRKEL